MPSDITVGIMGMADPSAPGMPTERRVYVDLDGRLAIYSPARARLIAKKFRNSGIADLVDIAGTIDALALEIETTAGKS